jgi:hypothetical protein
MEPCCIPYQPRNQDREGIWLLPYSLREQLIFEGETPQRDLHKQPEEKIIKKI